MVLGHSRRGVDDPRRSLTALTGTTGVLKQPVPAETRESAPVSPRCEAVMGLPEFSTRAPGPGPGPGPGRLDPFSEAQ